MSVRLAASVLVLAAAVSGLAAGPAAALSFRSCPGSLRAYDCTKLTVPLDRSGAAPGTIDLQVATTRGAAERRKKGLLVALAGGPGQAAVPFIAQSGGELRALLRTRRLVVFDQRGTGRSGAISCPPLQRLKPLDPFPLTAVSGCASRLGAAAGAYGTAESVEDLEAVRRAFKADKLALMGVSYGTFVAQQYARAHPDTTELLVLDSVVPGDGGDAFALDLITRVDRVLGDQCGRGRCRGASTGVRKDLRKVVPLALAGKLRGRVPNARGRLRSVRYRSGVELLYALTAGDLNPYLQADVPGALAAAARGDLAPLLRLRRAAGGATERTKDSSAGLFTATVCSDSQLPYAPTDPLETKQAATEEALDQIDPASYAPWDRQTLKDAGATVQCLGWPAEPTLPLSEEGLPDVPALLLSGRLDFRTPLEDARDVAVELPRARSVVLAGTGHSVLSSDETGCTAVALRRFAAGRPLGSPCRGKSNALGVMPRPPRSLSAFRSAPGVGGVRGRAVFAVLDTVADADFQGAQLELAGLPRRGGGLRSGRFVEGLRSLRLVRYAYVPGLRVTGTLRFVRGGGVRGRLRVDGPGRLDGTVRLAPDGSVRGRLGRRGVAFGASSAPAAAASARLAPLLGRRDARQRREGAGAGRARGARGGVDLGAAGRARRLRRHERLVARQDLEAALERRLPRPRD